MVTRLFAYKPTRDPDQSVCRLKVFNQNMTQNSDQIIAFQLILQQTNLQSVNLQPGRFAE